MKKYVLVRIDDDYKNIDVEGVADLGIYHSITQIPVDNVRKALKKVRYDVEEDGRLDVIKNAVSPLGLIEELNEFCEYNAELSIKELL
jgi:hypothetical protein